MRFCSVQHGLKTFKIYCTQNVDLTFKFVVFRISWEKDIWKEFLKLYPAYLGLFST